MDDLDRLRIEYARRAKDPRYRDWYSPFNPANIFLTQERDREIARLLLQYADGDLAARRVLDVGCGSGSELAKFMGYGAAAKNLFGVDLIGERLAEARDRYENLHFSCGNGTALPYPDGAFDLVLQFTVFTSILDGEIRRRIASEMLRVLSPRGFILWYDYRLNPTNPQTRGVEKAEIASLFPDCDILYRRVTLAPPLARLVAPRSWFLCATLGLFSPLKTHYLAAIRKEARGA